MLNQLFAALASVGLFGVLLALAFGATLAIGCALAYLDSQKEGEWWEW